MSWLTSASRLVFPLAFTLGGCPATTPVRPEPPEPVGPPRGADLALAVQGAWEGVAKDGTATDEDVEIIVESERYDLVAGLVEMASTWRVDGDLVVLAADPDAAFDFGSICFRPSVVTATHLEGVWAYGDDDGTCEEPWYGVRLDRLR